MKSLAQKLIALTFIVALSTGCASVTDAGLSQQQAEKPDTEQVQPDQPQDIQFGTEQDVQPIVDKPE